VFATLCWNVLGVILTIGFSNYDIHCPAAGIQVGWTVTAAFACALTFYAIRNEAATLLWAVSLYWLCDAAFQFFWALYSMSYYSFDGSDDECDDSVLLSVLYIITCALSVHLGTLCWQFSALAQAQTNKGSSQSIGWLSRCYQRLVRSPWIVMVVIITWLFTGTLVYKYANDWCWSNAFYFAVQAGFSVGFGSIAETSTTSRIYSCIHVLGGASIAVGAIGYFAEGFLDKQDTLRAKLKERRRIFLAAAKGEIGQQDMHAELMMEKSGMTTGVKNAVLLFLVWVGIGAVVSVRTQNDWDLAFGFEFAIAAMSTGGLQGFGTSTSSCSSHPQIPDGEAIFVGLYCLSGIPIFGLLMGKMAGFLTDGCAEARQQAKQSKKMDRGDFLTLKKDELFLLRKVMSLQVSQLESKEVVLEEGHRISRAEFVGTNEEFNQLADAEGFVGTAEMLAVSAELGLDDAVSKEDARTKSTKITFLEYLCLQAVQDNLFDTDFIQDMKDKYANLQCAL